MKFMRRAKKRGKLLKRGIQRGAKPIGKVAKKHPRAKALVKSSAALGASIATGGLSDLGIQSYRAGVQYRDHGVKGMLKSAAKSAGQDAAVAGALVATEGTAAPYIMAGRLAMAQEKAKK